jgi:hypothetical protein
MINIATLNRSDIGKWVVCKKGSLESKGRIKSWNGYFIFVVFTCDNNWDNFNNYTGCAVKPSDLSFV